MKRTILMTALMFCASVAVAQPTCPEVVEVRVAASLLPDGQPVTAHARWLTDWRGTISSARVDNVVTGPNRPRGEMHPQLRRAIQNAIEEQVRCSPHPQGESPSHYPFVRDVTARPGG